MAVNINNPKLFSVKFQPAGMEYGSVTETHETTSRGDAKDIVTANHPGCKILDCWETPRQLPGTYSA